jgi:hypothetical protein
MLLWSSKGKDCKKQKERKGKDKDEDGFWFPALSSLGLQSPLFIQPATKKCIGWIFTLVACRNSKGQPPGACLISWAPQIVSDPGRPIFMVHYPSFGAVQLPGIKLTFSKFSQGISQHELFFLQIHHTLISIQCRKNSYSYACLNISCLILRIW